MVHIHRIPRIDGQSEPSEACIVEHCVTDSATCPVMDWCNVDITSTCAVPPVDYCDPRDDD